MIRAYAYLSRNHPMLHVFNILLVLAIMAFCAYQLLGNQQIEYSIGFIAMFLPFMLFAKSAQYRSKYLHGK